MNQDLKNKINQAIGDRPIDDLALGFLRYEALRKLNVVEFAVLIERNLRGENFDEMIDEWLLLH